MAYTPRTYVPGSKPDAADLNRISQGIVTVAGNVASQAAAAQSIAVGDLTSRLRIDGTSKMTGNLNVNTGALQLYGSNKVDGKYQGNGINFDAGGGSVLLNGSPLITDATGGQISCMASVTNAYVNFSTVKFASLTQTGSGTGPKLALRANGTSIYYQSSTRIGCLAILSASVTAGYLRVTLGGTGVEGVSTPAINNMDPSKRIYITCAALTEINDTSDLDCIIECNGYVDATLTVLALM